MPRLEPAVLLICAAGSLLAFDPAKDLVVRVEAGALTLRIPEGAHVKRNTFKVALQAGPGKLNAGPLPPEDARDEAGDPIWRGAVRVPLRGEGLGDPVDLLITLQPCTEGKDSVCYLPQRRTLRIPRAEIPGTDGKL